MVSDTVERDKREMEEKCMLEVLPGEILGFIMEKMDISSICSISTTCKTFNSLASKTLSILPNLHLSDTPLPINLLMPLISRNPNLQSLRADCRRLKETPINYLLRPSLQHLYLHNCIDCYKKLASKIGECCRDLRCLYLDAIVGRRAGSYLTDQLRKLVTGCSQLQAYLVGGCVRNLLLKRIPKDFDVITTAQLKQIKKLFHYSHIVGRRFPICRVHIKGSIIEVYLHFN